MHWFNTHKTHAHNTCRISVMGIRWADYRCFKTLFGISQQQVVSLSSEEKKREKKKEKKDIPKQSLFKLFAFGLHTAWGIRRLLVKYQYDIWIQSVRHSISGKDGLKNAEMFIHVLPALIKYFFLESLPLRSARCKTV